MISNANILFCVLNWGLGHASRSSALIELLSQNNTIHIASSGEAGLLLRENFPKLSYHELPDYNIQYAKGANQAFKIASQGIKVLSCIKHEHGVVSKLQDSFHFNTIISDSRPGCYLAHCKSIYLCHQLQMQGKGAWFANWLHHRYIHHFQEVWIPDQEGSKNISGALSQTSHPHAKYIGWLSQCAAHEDHIKPAKNILAILSGPEPQRSILEGKLFELQRSLSFTIVGGSSKTKEREGYIPFANKDDLSQLIQTADIIISRTGYSTLMDLMVLKKKGILIPTPGQSEQEYLGNHLAGNDQFEIIPQSALSLDKITEAIKTLRA